MVMFFIVVDLYPIFGAYKSNILNFSPLPVAYLAFSLLKKLQNKTKV